MNLGDSLFRARKKSGLSQEAVAEKLGVSRQTISKWETDETLPDLCQSKKLSRLYHLTLDELVDFDVDVKELEQVIQHTSDEVQQKVDWTKLWAQKYPVLAAYKQEVCTDEYVTQLKAMLQKLSSEYGYNKLDALLVLKDILGGFCNVE